MLKSKTIFKRIKNLIFFIIIVIICINAYKRIFESRANETIEMSVSVSDNNNTQEVKAEAVLSNSNKYVLTLPKNINGKKIKKYYEKYNNSETQEVITNEDTTNEIILTEEQVKEKSITLNVQYDTKEVSNNESEKQILYNQNYTDGTIEVSGYMPWDSEVKTEYQNSEQKEFLNNNQTYNTEKIVTNKILSNENIEIKIKKEEEKKYAIFDENGKKIETTQDENFIKFNTQELKTFVIASQNYSEGEKWWNNYTKNRNWNENYKEEFETKCQWLVEDVQMNISENYTEVTLNAIPGLKYVNETNDFYTNLNQSNVRVVYNNKNELEQKNISLEQIDSAKYKITLQGVTSQEDINKINLIISKDTIKKEEESSSEQTITIFNSIKKEENEIFESSSFLGIPNLERQNIKQIKFANSLENEPESSYDISSSNDNSIKAWFKDGYLTIASNTVINTNYNSNNLFAYIGYNNGTENTFVNLNNLYTYGTISMNNMFYRCGYNKMAELKFEDNFNTKNVTSMNNMFFECGKNSLNKIYLGDGFENITNDETIFKECGNENTVLYVSDNLYSEIKKIKLNNQSSETLNYDLGNVYKLNSINVTTPKSGEYEQGQIIKITIPYSEKIYYTEEKQNLDASTVPMLKIKFGDGKEKIATISSISENCLTYIYYIEDDDSGDLQIVDYKDENIYNKNKEKNQITDKNIVGYNITAKSVEKASLVKRFQRLFSLSSDEENSDLTEQNSDSTIQSDEDNIMLLSSSNTGELTIKKLGENNVTLPGVRFKLLAVNSNGSQVGWVSNDCSGNIDNDDIGHGRYPAGYAYNSSNTKVTVTNNNAGDVDQTKNIMKYHGIVYTGKYTDNGITGSDWKYTENNITGGASFVIGSDGKFTIQGLNTNYTYTIVEVTTVEGYGRNGLVENASVDGLSSHIVDVEPYESNISINNSYGIQYGNNKWNGSQVKGLKLNASGSNKTYTIKDQKPRNDKVAPKIQITPDNNNAAKTHKVSVKIYDTGDDGTEKSSSCLQKGTYTLKYQWIKSDSSQTLTYPNSTSITIGNTTTTNITTTINSPTGDTGKYKLCVKIEGLVDYNGNPSNNVITAKSSDIIFDNSSPRVEASITSKTSNSPINLTLGAYDDVKRNDESGLSSSNSYQYYLSTSSTSLTGGSWKNYTAGGSTVTISSEGYDYYLFVRQVKDKADNLSSSNGATVTVSSTKYHRYGPYRYDKTPPNAPTLTVKKSSSSGTQLGTVSAGGTSTLWTNTASTYIGLSATDNTNGTGMDGYAYATSSSGSKTAISGNNTTVTATTSGVTRYFYAKDKVGNYSSATTLTVKMDSTNPTLTVTSNTTVAKSHTATVTIQDTGGSNLANGTYAVNYKWTQSTSTPSSYYGDNSGTVNITISNNASSGRATITNNKLDGTWYLHVKVTNLKDNASNTVSPTAYGTFKFDNTAPTCTITANPSTTPTNANSITYTFKFSEDVQNFDKADITITNGIASTFNKRSASEYTLVVTYRADGNQSVSISAGVCTDLNSNGNIAAKSGNILIDRTAPTNVKLTASPSGWTNSIITLTGSAIDSGSGIRYYQFTNSSTTPTSGWSDVNPASTSTVTKTKTVSSSSTWYFWVKDAVGNTACSSSLTTSYETTKPIVSASVTSATSSSSINIVLKATDSGGSNLSSGNSYQYYLSKSSTSLTGGSWTTYTASGSTITISEGSDYYLFVKQVKDNAGNISDTYGDIITVSYTKYHRFGPYRYDKTPPNAPTLTVKKSNSYGTQLGTVSSGNSSTIWTNTETTYVELSATDNSNGIGIDGYAYSSYTTGSKTAITGNNTTVTATTAGTTRYFFSKDKVANYSSYTTLTAKLDKTNPTVSITSDTTIARSHTARVTIQDTGGSNLANGTYAVSYKWSQSTSTPSSYSGDNSGTVNITINNSNSGNADITNNTLDGTWYLHVKVTNLKDNATNTVSPTTYGTFKFDNTAPTCTITANPSTTPTNVNSITYTFKFSEDVQNFDKTDITITNGTAGTFTKKSAREYTLVVTYRADGNQSVSISANVCTDLYLNPNTAAKSGNILIDRTAPTVSVLANASTSSYKTISATIKAQDTGGSDLATSNSYQYVLSTSSTSLSSTSWSTYSASGSTVTLGTGLNGTYYLFVKNVKDKAGNTSSSAGTSVTINGTTYQRFGPYVFDNKAPEINYKYVKTNNPNINVTDKTVAITFTVTDEHLSTCNLSADNIRFTIAGYQDYTTHIKKSLSTATSVTNGKQYTLTLSGFDEGDGKLYSGTLTLTFSAGFAKDVAGNSNAAKTITVTYDTGEEVPIDVVSPVWQITDITKNIGNKSLSFKLVGVDKYLSSSSLTNAGLSLYVNNTKQTNAKFTIGTPTKGTETITYQVTITNVGSIYGEGFVRVNANTLTDITGNKNKQTDLNLSTIDFVEPTITVSTTSCSASKSVNLTITAKDTGTGLASSNSYQYYLSTSSTNTVGGSWKTYTSGSQVTLGAGLTGKYYLYVKQVKDNVGNSSLTSGTIVTVDNNIKAHKFGEYVFDNSEPTISVSPENAIVCKNKNVTITVEDVGEAGLSSSNSYQYYLSTSSTSLTGGSWQNYTNGTAFNIGSGLTGTYYLFVKQAQDALGNTTSTGGTITTISNVKYHRYGTYVFDNSEPIITVSPTSTTVCKNTNITITVKEVGTAGLSSLNSYQYYLSTSSTSLTGGNWQNYTNGTSFNAGSTLTGTYYLFIKQVKDTLDNTSSTSGTITTVNNVKYHRYGTYIFDNTKPTNVTISANPSGWTNGTITLTGSGIDTTSGIKYFKFTNSNTEPTSGWTEITPTTQTITKTQTVSESNIWYFWVKDAVGNTQCSSSVNTYYETVKPVINVDVASKSSNASISIVLKTSDTGGSGLSSSNSYQYYLSTSSTSLSGGTWKNYTTTGTTITVAEEGYDYYLFVKQVKDNAGNISTTEGTTTTINSTNYQRFGPYRYDKTAPNAPNLTVNKTNNFGTQLGTVSSGQSKTIWTNTESTYISLSGTDNANGIGVGGYAYSTSQTETKTDLQSNNLTITATTAGTTRYLYTKDKVGNYSTATTLTMKLDKEVPTIEVSSNLELSRKHTATVKISDTGGSNLVNGIYTINYKWTQSTEEPSSYTGDNSGTAQITISNNAESGTTTITKDTIDGTWYLHVKVTNLKDNATNTVSKAAYGTFAFDNTPPKCTITANPSKTPTNVDIITYTFTFSEDVKDFEKTDIIVTNGIAGTFTKKSASVYTLEVTHSKDGDQYLTLNAGVCTDLRGNENLAASSGKIYKDKTLPKIIVTANPTTTSYKTLIANIKAEDNESGLDSTVNSYQYVLSTSDTLLSSTDWTNYTSTGENVTLGTGLNGTYYLFIKEVKDKAGNTSNSNGTTVTINGTEYQRFGPYVFDNKAPEINYKYVKTNNPNINVTDKTVAVTFTVTDEHFKVSNLTVDKIDFKIAGYSSSETHIKKSLSDAVSIENGKQYTLTLSGFDEGDGYLYSGTLSLIFPKGFAEDIAGNVNASKTMTITYDTGEEIPIDVVSPIWQIAEVSKDLNNKSISFKIVGSDKYLNATSNSNVSSLTTSSLSLYVNNTKQTNAKFTIGTPTKGTETITYQVTITNVGSITGEGFVRVAANTLTDTTGNKNKQTDLNVQTIDFIEPTITVSPESTTVCKNTNVTIITNDIGTGLSSSNTYKYYLSTSSTSLTGGSEVNYTSGTAFNIGSGLTGTYYLFVKQIQDNVGNNSIQDGTVVTINNAKWHRYGPYEFDNSEPTITVSPESTLVCKNKDIKITVAEVGTAGLSNSNKYQYYLSTSSTSLTGGSEVNYTSGTSFNIGSNLTGTYYLFVKQVQDTLGNASTTGGTIVTINNEKWHRYGAYIFDNSAPTITVSPENVTVCKNKNVTITVADVGPAGLLTTNSYQYYLSTSSTSLVGGSWKNYTSGTAFNLGSGLTGTYYLFVKEIKDTVLNESSNSTTVNLNNINCRRYGTYVFDNTPPQITYKYANTVIDHEKKQVTIIWTVTDTHYESQSLIQGSTINWSKMTIKIDGVQPDWTKAERSLTKEDIQNGVKYTLVVSNLDQGKGTDYSGYVTVALNSDIVLDKAGNGNVAKTITVGVDEPTGNNKTEQVVDVVDPVWNAKNILKSNKKLTVDLEGTDKYFKSGSLTTDKIKVFVDGEDVTSKVNKKLGNGTEITNNGIKYGINYNLEITGFEQNDIISGRNYLDYSGNVKLVIDSGTLLDNYTNTNKKTTLDMGTVDFIKPRIYKIESSKSQENKTATLVFRAVDKYFDSENITEEKIKVYIDGEETNTVGKTLTKEPLYEIRNNEQVQYGEKYTLVLSNFKDPRTQIDYDREYTNWSGRITVKIQDGTVIDKSGNINSGEELNID